MEWLWVKTNSYVYILIVLGGFTCASFFNGAMIVGAAVFLMIIFFQNLKYFFTSSLNYKINIKVVLTLSFVIISSLFVYFKKLTYQN